MLDEYFDEYSVCVLKQQFDVIARLVMYAYKQDNLNFIIEFVVEHSNCISTDDSYLFGYNVTN